VIRLQTGVRYAHREHLRTRPSYRQVCATRTGHLRAPYYRQVCATRTGRPPRAPLQTGVRYAHRGDPPHVLLLILLVKLVNRVRMHVANETLGRNHVQ